MFMNMYVHGYVYVYDSICWALKCPVHCAEQFLELKICISPQFRAIDPPNPARGFIQQNENVRFATAACMQKYGNVSFATVACAKCMRYGGRGGDPYHGGGGGGNTGHGTIYIYISPTRLYLYTTCFPGIPVTSVLVQGWYTLCPFLPPLIRIFPGFDCFYSCGPFVDQRPGGRRCLTCVCFPWSGWSRGMKFHFLFFEDKNRSL